MTNAYNCPRDYSYILGQADLVKVLPADFLVIADGLLEKLFQPLQSSFVEARLGPGIGDIGNELHNLIRGHLIYRVHIDQAEQFVQDL